MQTVYIGADPKPAAPFDAMAHAQFQSLTIDSFQVANGLLLLEASGIVVSYHWNPQLCWEASASGTLELTLELEQVPPTTEAEALDFLTGDELWTLAPIPTADDF